jgi:FkbM family methyltransferase
VTKASIIFDIGANTGIYSLIAKAINPSVKVFAFEPQPNIYSILIKNNLINAFDIHCEQIALSSRSGKAAFYNYGEDTFRNSNTTAGSLNQNWRRKKQNHIEVDTDTLLNYCVKHRINKIDLIKMDVETHEYEVLKGYNELIQSHRPYILVEIQSRDIGERIENLINAEVNDFSFYQFSNDANLKKTKHLGNSSDGRNYLIVPGQLPSFTYNF